MIPTINDDVALQNRIVVPGLGERHSLLPDAGLSARRGDLIFKER